MVAGRWMRKTSSKERVLILTIFLIFTCSLSKAPAQSKETKPPAGTSDQPTTQCRNDSQITYPEVHWTVLRPEESHWSQRELDAAKDYAKSIKTKSWLLIENGKVVDSFGGIDQLNRVASARKSLMSAMYGIAVAEHKIDLSKTLEQLGIDDNYPSLSPAEKQATVRDLLMARSGVYHEAIGETPAMKAARPKRGSHSHGSFWYYNNWDFNTLGTIFNQSTHESLFAFFKDHFAVPLHMEDYKVADQSYVNGPESIHPYYNIYMSTRDMGRFGLLFLGHGCWQEKEIIPATWVIQTTTPYSTVSALGLGGAYGYMWWVADRGTLLPNVTIPDGSYAALGVGPQMILVIPSEGIVLVHGVGEPNPEDFIPMGNVGTLVAMILHARKM
jgi:CubicO group peptidase (beta-lactamase class C family)